MDTKINKKDYKLEKIHYLICGKFEDGLKFQCEWFTNNKEPKFTDQEIITLYLFAMQNQGIFKIKQIYSFAKDYLLEWFPNLGNYQAFNNWLNRISNVMNSLVESLFMDFAPEDCFRNHSVLDSIPIISCSGKRRGKVAVKITDKGYCPTKGIYYYESKLKTIGFCLINRFPHLEQIIFTPVSVNNLSFYQEFWSEIESRTFFEYKIYNDKDFFQNMVQKFGSEMLTLVKAVKGMPEVLKKNQSWHQRPLF